MTSAVPETPAAPILELVGITKRFGAVAANRGIHLNIYPGEVHALLGENGAGKSTLMSILSGRHQADAGEIRLQGRPVILSSPAQALALGIGMVYQRFMLIESFTVAENILLAEKGAGGLLNLDTAAQEIEKLGRKYGLAVDPRRKVGDLSMGERQRVEILKLLRRDAEILIFDEPTSILTPGEIDSFFQVVRNLAAQGRSIIFISHKLDEVMALSSRISIMRRGRIAARDLLPLDIGSKRELARLMVGREVVLQVDKQPVDTGRPVLQVQGLAAQNVLGETLFKDIDLSVAKGEILALTGVAGNGQDALVAALAGLAPFTRGSITNRGKIWSSRAWMADEHKDMAYIPADRDHTGSVSNLDLTANFLLTRIDGFRTGPFVSYQKATRAVADALQEHEIHTPAGPDSRAGQLSGGNLQKFLLARELSKNPDLVIADQPTQGLDVSATEHVWQVLLQRRRTSGILLVSGDLKEVLSLADRIAVMFRGGILRTFRADDTGNVARIGLFMAGVNG
jgi:simple sugar transport system ATP-binding protein